MALDSLARLQATIRGHSVRTKLEEAKSQFLEIVREIEGDSCLVTWKRNEQLTIPRFLDTGRCPFSDNQPVLQREGHHSRDERNQTISKSVVQCSETDDPTRAEETGLSDEKGVQTVMCGTNDVESDQGTVTIVLPVKCMEDVGCQTSLSDDDPECGQCYAVSTKETETEKQPDCHSDVIGRSDSRVCVSETSSVSSSEHMESPAVPVSLVEIQTEGATVKASSPVREMKRVSLSLPASTPVDSRRTSLLAETVHLEPPRGDTRVRVSDDSTLISVTQMSSTWPSDDSGEIDLVEDRATLEKTREELALELLWIRQAIDSRKQYLAIKSRLDREEAAKSGQRKPSASDS